MVVYVAMLRGINVGGQKSIRMENLRASFEALGYDSVRTYVQTGNVIFSHRGSTDHVLSKKIGKKLLSDYGFPVALVIRSSIEMTRIVERNPFLEDQRIDASKLHVTFLSDHPSRSSLPGMDRLNAASDQYRILGREIYLHCPNGYGRTKLSNNAIEKALSVRATTRNWKTVSTLEKIASELL